MVRAAAVRDAASRHEEGWRARVEGARGISQSVLRRPSVPRGIFLHVHCRLADGFGFGPLAAPSGMPSGAVHVIEDRLVTPSPLPYLHREQRR